MRRPGNVSKRQARPDVEISLVSAADRSLEKLLKRSNHDHTIVDAALLGRIPLEVQKSRHIIMVRLQLVLESLETARIRAGVII